MDLKRSSKVIITPEARVLRSLRLKRGLSMRKAGEVMGYSDSYISQIENGREDKPKGDKLLKFLTAYGVKYKHFRQLVKDWNEDNNDAEVVRTLIQAEAAPPEDDSDHGRTNGKG